MSIKIGNFMPFIVGLFLGWMQTGLFFQLSFTLSSGYGTYLLVTLCWLLGSVLGVTFFSHMMLPTRSFLVVSMIAYGACAILLLALPFQTTWWWVYGLLISLNGVYAGVFFARSGTRYSAQALFLRENNGFIVGIVCATILYLFFGRFVLWGMPVLLAGVLYGMEN